MSATERLCELLDERGMEYLRSAWSSGSAVWWKDASGVTWRAHDNEDDGLLTLYAYSSVTPAQAIAATLGAQRPTLPHFWTADGTLHIEPRRMPERVQAHLGGEDVTFECGLGTCRQEERGWTTEGDHARVFLTCGHDCMVETVADLPNFCPVCGARVEVD